MGKNVKFDDSKPLKKEYDVPRREITLKLCDSSHDVVDVDADDVVEKRHVHHARRFHDGSVAASVCLGRNNATGINHRAVSRALIDVSMSRGIREGDGTKKEVVALDGTDVTDSEEQKVDTNNDDTKTKKDNSKEEQFTPKAFYSLRKPEGSHAVYLDGKEIQQPVGRRCPLQHGQIIGLWGPDNFAYLVDISMNRESEEEAAKNNNVVGNLKSEGEDSIDIVSPKKRRVLSPTTSVSRCNPTAHEQLRKRAHQLMVGECTCAMCMDILVKSTFAYPCGHAFCADCTEDVNNTCPSCRGKVKGWMPARSFDTMIWATALQGCFDSDDAQFYLDRRKKGGEDDATEVEKACILGTGAKEAMGGTNAYLSMHQMQNFNAITLTTATVPPLFASSVNRPHNNNSNSLFGAAAASFPTTATSNPRFSTVGKSADDAICLD